MYKAYSLRVVNNFFNDYLSGGEEVKRVNKIAAKSGLDAFFDGDGSLVATKIMEDWFPSVNAQVFISHSHKDEKNAIGLAGWLNDKLGISSFIDSCVWGYSAELLKKLDKKFCLKDSGYYDYDRRNITNAHVNMMLATSLTKMIDQCECIIFLNTPRSISCKGSIENDGTESPWIYAEIEATRLLRVKTPKRMEPITKSLAGGRSIVLDEAISVKYDLDLKHFSLLEDSRIKMLNNCGMKGTDALDFLYNGI